MTFGNLFCPVHRYVCLVLYCVPQVIFEEKVCDFVNIEQPIKKVIQTVLNMENIRVNENL